MRTEDRAVWFAAYLIIVIVGALFPARGWAKELPIGDAEAWVAILERDGRAQFNTVSNDGRTRTEPLTKAQTTPLGSLWKLFVYLYLADRGIDPPDYQCLGLHADEKFCCAPQGSVGMQAALAQSCGHFFEPKRLSIDAMDWALYWRERGVSHRWLLDLGGLLPERRVSIAELLDTLAHTGSYARNKAQQALADVLVSGSAKGKFRHLGSLLRAKTYTWNHPTQPERFFGGFAGWLNDGSAVWAGAQGTSGQVIVRFGKQMAPLLERGVINPSAGCVDVDFFERYPIKRIMSLQNNLPASDGVMLGRYRIIFENGNELELQSTPEMRLSHVRNHPRIQGRFTINDYVARVLDREVDPQRTEAAKAFAVVARTYLVQNGQREGECHLIADSSATQRVSPNPPSEAARRLSYWTDGLILGAEGVRYHKDRSGPNRIAWSHAVTLAGRGAYFDEILQSAFPKAKINQLYGEGKEECERMGSAEQWINNQGTHWRSALLAFPGYEDPAKIRVCRLGYGNPYADMRSNRVYVRALKSSEDRIALTHEYLHVCFKNHPSGRDERFIEATAQKLLGADWHKKGALGKSEVLE